MCIECSHARHDERTLRDAAPDLLAALEEAEDILSRLYHGESVVGEVLDCIDIARIAVRKAKGE